MWIKVDISTKNKDAYSIYYKKWFFCRWTRIGEDYKNTEGAIRKACELKEGGYLPPVYKGFLVKLDFSIASKKRDNDVTIPGCYAIYMRKSIFHKWKEVSKYACLNMAIWDLTSRKDKPPFYI